MEIEIRRNRDIQFNVTCQNPASLEKLLQLSDEQKRLRDECDNRRKAIEDMIWRYFQEHIVCDLNGNHITPETHEIGYDFTEPDDNGISAAVKIWVRPKKSEYAK